MVSIPGRVPDPRRRIGLNGARPLSVRFAEAQELAAQQIPVSNREARQCLSLMESEHNLDLIYQTIEQSKPRPAEPSPELRTEWNALSDLIRKYNSACLAIKEAQKWLWRADKDWKHKLLHSLRADMFTVPAQLSTDWEFPADIGSTRQAAKDVFAKLQWVHGLLSQIDELKAFDSSAPEQQAFELCRALAAENAALKDRVTALEGHFSALEARVRPPKQRKATRSQNSKRKSHDEENQLARQ